MCLPTERKINVKRIKLNFGTTAGSAAVAMANIIRRVMLILYQQIK